MLKNSPFVGYTVEEVKRMEANFYTLELGGDFVSEENHFLLTKFEVAKLYNRTFKNLLDIVESDSEQDSKYAIDLLGKLFIKPLRLQ